MNTTNQIDNRTIRVFISSTFQDMQDERDELMKKTFPILRRMAAERDVMLTELDLRWGITAEESESGKVVEICFREIENSIPFFLGIIGNRYGWVPSQKDLSQNVTSRYKEVDDYLSHNLSVTEMEMQFGVLQREEDMHAYFYIKKDDDKQEDSESDNPAMLERLKSEVRSSRYPSSFYRDPEDLSRQVEKAFVDLLDELFPVEGITVEEKVKIGQQSYINQLCQSYIRDPWTFDALDSWLKDSSQDTLVVTGESGLGKSALLANWLKEKQKDAGLGYNVIFHFVGNGGGECDWEYITRALANEISAAYGFSFDEPVCENTLIGLLSKVTNSARPLLIVIDAVNQITERNNAKLLNWLPSRHPDVKILYSTLEADSTMSVFRNRDYPIMELFPMRLADREKLVSNYLGVFAKSLQQEQIQRIVRDKQCENTLILRTLLDELINFGIYEKLDARIDYYLSQSSASGFYQRVLQVYEDDYRDYGDGIIRHLLSLIALSRNGLSEDAILEITGIKPLGWSQFSCAFSTHLISKRGLVSFSHANMREAVFKRFLLDAEWEQSCRYELIEHFKKEENHLAWEELAFQLDITGRTQELYGLIIRIPVFDYLYLNDPFSLGKYWRCIIREGNFSICDYANQIIPDGDLVYYYTHIAVFASRFLNDFSAAIMFNEKIANFEGPSASNGRSIAFNNMAIEYGHKGDYEKAISYAKQSLCLDEASNNEQGMSDSYNNLGTFYNELGNDEKAIEAYKAALTIRERIYGERHTMVAQCYHNLGNSYGNIGRTQEAKECLEKAIGINIALSGANSLEVAKSYNSMGALCNEEGEYELAVEYYNKALEIYRSCVGENHFLYSDTLFNATRNRYNRKEISAQEALSINLSILHARIELMGKDSLDVASSYQRIGELYFDLEDYDSSKKSFTESLSITSRIAGPFNANCRKIEQYLAYNEYYLGNYQEAARHFEKVLRIQEATGKDFKDKNYLYVTTSAAQMYEYAGMYEKAIDFYQQSTSLVRESEEEDSNALANSLNGTAWCLHLLGRDVEGLPYVKEALQYSPDNMNIVDTLSCIYVAIGDFENAIFSCERLKNHYLEQNDEDGVSRINERLKLIEGNK